MRTNKFIPFYIALSLHAIPLTYFLLKKSAPPAAVMVSSSAKASPSQGIDLTGFSISQKPGYKTIAPTQTNSIKTVGLPAASYEVHNNGNTGSSASASGSSGTGTGNDTNGNHSEPVFINFREPIYPPVARQKGYEGKVKIKAYYNQVGVITKVEIIESSGIKMLDETVKKTASGWKLSVISAGSFEKKFEFKLKN
jgi:TonB family protein